VQRSKSVVLVTLILAATAVACAQVPASERSASPESGILATIGDEKITDADLEAIIGSRLMMLQQQIYDTKRQGLEQEIFNRLVDKEAALQGISKEEYLKVNITDKVGEPAEEEIAKVMAQYRARLPQEDDQARQQVVGFLTQQARQQVEQQLRQKLFAAGNVKILLEPPRVKAPVQAYNPSRGPADAPITLIEYTDYQCPYCGRAQETIAAILKRYDGLVRHVFKHLPLPMHQQARPAAEASMCAGDQGKFWEIHDWMFANRASINRDAILAQAAELGLDVEKLTQCLDEKVHSAEVDQDMNEARGFGINGTPGFVVNGRIISGAQPLEAFTSIINEELTRAGIDIPPEPPAEEPQAAAEGDEATAEAGEATAEAGTADKQES
jgi:protein-disulfide isomerase